MGGLSYFWSEPYLTNKRFLLLLIIVNTLGTVYGYYWYASQLVETAELKPFWMLPFVPDSPTASLLFTITLLFLFMDARIKFRVPPWIRGFVEALAVMTSVKYGLWAVSMIIAGTLLGDALEWEHWMLMISHLGMAVEALLFVRFFTISGKQLVLASIWSFANDFVDYRFDVYPYLSERIEVYIRTVCVYTVALSAFAIACTQGIPEYFKRKQV